MKIEELKTIVELKNLKEIEKALKAAGFIDCKRDTEMRKINLVDIFCAPEMRETDYCYDANGRAFEGSLYEKVHGWKQYEFAVVQLLAPYKRGCKDLSTKKMLIYAKETTK